MTRQEFVSKYGGFVKSATSGTGIFPETLIAQAIIESSDSSGNVGGSKLAKNYNNFFGIKANKSWKGKSVNMKTGEFTGTPDAVVINDFFRAYDSPEDSIADYVKFLKGNKRYANAGVFNAKTPQEQGALLQKAGYATGAGYGKLVGDVAHTVSGWLGGVKESATKFEKEAVATIEQTATRIGRSPVMLITGTLMILAGIGFFYKYKTQNS